MNRKKKKKEVEEEEAEKKPKKNLTTALSGAVFHFDATQHNSH